MNGNSNQIQRLERLAHSLIDQEAAQIIVPPDGEGEGSWFGGGNLWQDDAGDLWLVGRYRNPGDSRTGIAQGTRGFALAAFHSSDAGATFSKVWQRSKSELAPPGEEVLSIEGSVMIATENGIELLVSTEKSSREYPASILQFQKPGTGIWTIDRLVSDSVQGLKTATAEPLLASCNPEILHVKDPFVYSSKSNSQLLGVCTHPFNWSSSNTILREYSCGHAPARLSPSECLPRGLTWDVAIHRITSIVDVLSEGESESLQLVFYDGGECVRNLDAHRNAVDRPRGYSCEEVGGLAVMRNGDLQSLSALSRWHPAFTSPHGTGCSRYVDVLVTKERWYATWQQSQADGSQPLVCHSLDAQTVSQLLND